MKSKEGLKRILPNLLPLVGLVLMILIFVFTTDGLIFQKRNITNIINQVFPLLMAAMGAIFVYAQGYIDVSIGAAIGCCALGAAIAMSFTNSILIGFIVAVCLGVIINLVNGFITTKFKVLFIMTSLFLMFTCRGILTLATLSPVSSGIDLSRFDIFNTFWVRIVVIIGMVLIFGYILNFTKTGKYIKAIGSNHTTSEHAGINIDKYRIRGYILLGISIGISAFFVLTRIGTVTKSTGSGLEMDIMIALLLGGLPQGGGTRSKIQSAVIGSLTYIILKNGLILSNVDVNLVSMIRGILFVVLVAIFTNRKVRVLPR